MRRVPFLRLLVAPAVAVVAGALAVSATGAASAQPAAPTLTLRSAPVCAAAPVGSAQCLARVRLNSVGRPAASAKPAGYSPKDLQSAYKLTGLDASGRTVAIVDAYDDPTAEADLGVYRHQYGLPACTTANGCFRKVGQDGGPPPAVDASWAQEISLDVDMVSAACPTCHILLVEASSNSFNDLATAVDYAASQPGVVAISNSYGGNDNGPISSYDHPGIAITASTGDAGYGVESPASFDSVIAVGGTSLSRSGSARGWNEKTWDGAGSGCSLLNARPAWQPRTTTHCVGKASADVSAVADPATGVAVYDSTPYQGSSGWLVFGGTSASSPIVASVYALSGNTAGYPASYTWAHASGLFDVTKGSNGTCYPLLWCNSRAGWDGPTGLGTPNGTSAF